MKYVPDFDCTLHVFIGAPVLKRWITCVVFIWEFALQRSARLVPGESTDTERNHNKGIDFIG